MEPIQEQLGRLYPNENRDLGVNVEGLKQAIVGNTGETLMLLLGAGSPRSSDSWLTFSVIRSASRGTIQCR